MALLPGPVRAAAGDPVGPARRDPTDPLSDVGVAERCHRPIADDLVAAVGVPVGARVLDLGAGTGVAAAAARAVAGPTARVVALDPGCTPIVAGVAAVRGAAPGLPFAPCTFDVVLAQLVLGHLHDPRRALHDLVRVLRPGGRVGLATWGRTDDPPPGDAADAAERAALACWDAVVARHADLDEIDDAAEALVPWEATFTDPAQVRLALVGAHLRVTTTVGRRYPVSLTHAEWLDRTALGARSRALAARLGPDAAAGIRAEVGRALVAAGVPDPVPGVDEVVLTVAVAPFRGPLPR